MPETLRFYRLRVRNAADSGDLLVVTSVRGGTNPYIAAAPSGDGQSFTPLTGETSTGSYTLLVVDEGSVASAVTSILADANARQQLLSKRAFLESSVDGSSWTGFVPGWVNACRLVTAGKFEFAIGDSRREEISTDVFKSVLLKRDPKTAFGMPGKPTFTRFPNCTMLIGGPVKSAFWSAKDNGGWIVKVSQVVTTGAANTHYVQLKTQSFGWRDPRQPLLGIDEFPSREFINHLNEETQSYFKPSTNWLGASSPIKGYFPDLYYRVETPTGTLVGYFTPISEPRGSDVKRDDYLTRIGNSSSFWVAWEQSIQPSGSTVAAPSVGTEYRLYLFASDISEKNPLHVAGHPLDIRENLWLDASMPYNAAALAATRAAIGNELYIALRVKSSSKMSDVALMLDGLFGTATRINSAGERELFPTRIKDSAAPGLVATLADLRSTEGTPWEIDEQTVCNRITLKQQRFGDWAAEDGSGTPPADGMLSSPDTTIVDYGAATTPGDHETVYEIPGRIINPANAEDFIVGVAGEAFDRYGQGAIAGELHCLPSMTAQLGQEIILDLPHLPNAIAGRSPVSQRGGQRIVQIVQRTETPSGPDIRVDDAGTTVQAVTLPTFTLGLNAIDGRKYADLVITNAGALAAAGIKIRIETATGAGAPSAGTLLTTLDPAVQSTMTLPALDAGTKVWIRMRSEIFGNRPSAWTAFTGLQLTALDPPTSFAVAAAGADISRRLLSWVIGTNASDIPIEVYLRLTSDPSSADRLVTTLPPGSTQYELIGLDVANRTATVRHRETPPAAGVSASVTVAVNTSGTAITLNPPTDPVGFSGPVLVPMPRPHYSTTQGVFGIDVIATQFPSSVEIFMAVGAGAYASAGSVESLQGQRTIWSSVAPNDGLARKLKARHTRAGTTESAFTAEVIITNPWSYARAMYLPIAVDALGRIKRSNPFDDGKFAPKASDTSGTIVDASVTESGGKSINRFLGKALAGDPDSLDGVGDGSTYSRPLASRISAGKPLIDFSEAIHTNKHLGNIPDTAARFASPVPNATSDVVLVASAGITLGGNNAVKTTSGSWNEQVYSKDAFSGGAFASVVATAQAGENVILGLNTDPLTDASYTSLDYALQIHQASGRIYRTESGAQPESWVYSAGDVLAITYDGSAIRYMQNGVVLRTVLVGTGLNFFFDSSFDGVGSSLSNIRFGPMSSNNAAAIGAGNLIGGINESGGKAINRLLGKALAADPDSLDSAPDGTTYKKIVSVVSGQITPPSSVGRNRCRLTKSGGAFAIGSGGQVAMAWDTEIYDVGGLHDNVTLNTRITIPSGGNTGAWLFMGQVSFAGSAVGSRREVYISKNGTPVAVFSGPGTANGPTYSAWFFDDAPTVGDYYELMAFQDSGGNLNVNGGFQFFSAQHLW